MNPIELLNQILETLKIIIRPLACILGLLAVCYVGFQTIFGTMDKKTGISTIIITLVFIITLFSMEAIVDWLKALGN